MGGGLAFEAEEPVKFSGFKPTPELLEGSRFRPIAFWISLRLIRRK